MDEIARGIAMASLILQSSLLRSLVANGAMTRAQALNVIEKALAASHGKGSSKEEQDVALVTVETLQGSGRAWRMCKLGSPLCPLMGWSGRAPGPVGP